MEEKRPRAPNYSELLKRQHTDYSAAQEATHNTLYCTGDKQNITLLLKRQRATQGTSTTVLLCSEH